MATWDRSTPWRQGAILTAEAAAAFGLRCEAAPTDTAVVVISHDCDLAQDPVQEPRVEAIVGRFIAQSDGNYLHARNLRCLHLTCTAGTQTTRVELQPRGRILLDKIAANSPAMAHFTPHPDFRLTDRERRILQRWLAARYDRSAFPDEFDRRLKTETGVADTLAKSFKEAGKYIPGVFFDVDEGEDRAREGAADLYQLVITILYSTDDDPERAQKAALELKQRILEIFHKRCCSRNDRGFQTWRWIELQAVEVVSDEALTYRQSTLLRRWHADYISLRADPPQPIVET